MGFRVGRGSLACPLSAGPALCASADLVQAVGKGARVVWRPRPCEGPAGDSRLRRLAARAQAQVARTVLADHCCQDRGLAHWEWRSAVRLVTVCPAWTPHEGQLVLSCHLDCGFHTDRMGQSHHSKELEFSSLCWGGGLMAPALYCLVID